MFIRHESNCGCILNSGDISGVRNKMPPIRNPFMLNDELKATFQEQKAHFDTNETYLTLSFEKAFRKKVPISLN